MGITTSPSKLYNRLQQWSDEKLYFEADDYFQSLLSNLDLAKQSIEIECYIFEQDALGRSIISRLIAAANRGVNVRISIDGYGSLAWDIQHLEALNKSNIKVKIFHPLPWRLSLYRHVKFVTGFINKLIFLSSRINKRNHRKLYIIDKEAAWSGSLNISASHLSHEKGGSNWLDCGVTIKGDSVKDLSQSFNDVWQRKVTLNILTTSLPFRTNNNLIKRQQKNFELIRLIGNSKKRVWIMSAYLAPSKLIIRALKKAKSQGIDVKLLISKHSDVVMFPLVSTTFYEELIKTGIEIYEYNAQIIHAKTILIDDLLMVGSSNLNHRSFLHDLELDIILSKTSSIFQLEKKFKALIATTDCVTSKRLINQPWYKQLLGKLLWRLRYWL